MFHFGHHAALDSRISGVFNNVLEVLYEDPNPSLKDWKPQPTWMPLNYEHVAQRIKDFSVRDDDVWILSFPKTGTTVTCEMISVLINGLESKTLRDTDLLYRIPFLE